MYVGAHPDAIQRLTIKDALFETRNLPFDSDVYRIDSLAELVSELPDRLRHGPRVLKQHRGHTGIGVWRVEQADDGLLKARHALRGSTSVHMDRSTHQATPAPYFEPAAGGHMLAHTWQPRLAGGMVRAYRVEGLVAGFGHQAFHALHHGPDLPSFRTLRRPLESSWVGLLCERVGLSRDRLPRLWDCDFMLGEPAADGIERYVLCEIKVSSVSLSPPSAIEPLVHAVRRRIDP